MAKLVLTNLKYIYVPQINETCTLLEPWSSAAVDIIFNPDHYIIDLDFHTRSADLHGTLVGHVLLTHDSR